jgi:hypothetical protein|tara:strand:- start:33 stop:455 length:423 start_codon:yes stop_codon:yes gene_type:complete
MIKSIVKPVSLAAAIVLIAGCAATPLTEYRPITDPQSSVAYKYESDLSACLQIATAAEAEYNKRQADAMAANLVGGIIMGALLGAAIGDSSDFAAYGAASGALAGLEATDFELANGGPRRIADRCMNERGHKVLGDMGKG